MQPAFSNRRQSIAFALLLAALLALPCMPFAGLDRRDAYASVALSHGPFPWIAEKIFDETEDADIVFLGSSHIWTSIDARYVQTRLSEESGVPGRVFTLGWPWPGFDACYVVARDLLERRHVHMLVISDEFDDSGLRNDFPHARSTRWFRLAENSEALAGLPWLDRARLYGGAVLGMPRHLLSVARPNLRADPAKKSANYWTTDYRAADFRERLGALRARRNHDKTSVFQAYTAHGDATPADVLVFSPETRDAFEFSRPGIAPYQLHFARKLAKLCMERHTKLVMLHTPTLPESWRTTVAERERWSEALAAPVEIVGIPEATLFAGIPADDVPKLFYNDTHLNENGQDLFTPLITPALLDLYDSARNRR